MIEVIKVEYTVQPEYVETNKANIRKVMADLRSKNVSGFKYFSQLAEDGVTFMHIAIKENADVINPLNEMESFNAFRGALKASSPVAPPKSTKHTLVGSGHDLF